jgi:hypothetical protein
MKALQPPDMAIRLLEIMKALQPPDMAIRLLDIFESKDFVILAMQIVKEFDPIKPTNYNGSGIEYCDEVIKEIEKL